MIAYDEAKWAFENPLPSGDTLARAVGILVRSGATEAEARSWAADAVRDYGLVVDQDEFKRVIARGLRLARPPEVDEEPEEAEPEAATPVDVRPKLSAPVVPPVVAGLTAEQLLAIASSPGATKRRLRELEKATATAIQVSEKLDTARAQFDANVERTQAELAAKSEALEKGNLKLFVDRRAFEETAARARSIVAEQTRIANIGRYEQVGPSLVREFMPGYPRGDEKEDAHYPVSNPTPAAGLPLPREPVRRSRSMRRVSQEP
jgi:hypothetical protein